MEEEGKGKEEERREITIMMLESLYLIDNVWDNIVNLC